ncbi:hypothetical protein C8R44DRAFT_895516 [Mycena epipterygia]|nr:hypothetical protein C8R44DRAFT_895516 [Mycena epipterygia]
MELPAVNQRARYCSVNGCRSLVDRVAKPLTRMLTLVACKWLSNLLTLPKCRSLGGIPITSMAARSVSFIASTPLKLVDFDAPRGLPEGSINSDHSGSRLSRAAYNIYLELLLLSFAVNRVDNDQCALRVRAEPRETARARSTLITAAQGSRAAYNIYFELLRYAQFRHFFLKVHRARLLTESTMINALSASVLSRARLPEINSDHSGSRLSRAAYNIYFELLLLSAINRVDNGQRALRVRPEPCVRVPCVLDFAARQPDSLLLRIPADLAQVPTALDAPRLPRPSPIRRAGLTLCYVYCLASFSQAIRIPLSSPSAAMSAAESNAHSMTTALLGIVAGTLALIVIIVVASVWLFTHRCRRARHPSRSRAPYPPTLRAGLPGVDRASPGIEAIRGEVGERVSSFALHPLRSSRPPQDFRSRSVRLAFLAKPSTQEPASQTRAHSALPAHGAKEAALARSCERERHFRSTCVPANFALPLRPTFDSTPLDSAPADPTLPPHALEAAIPSRSIRDPTPLSIRFAFPPRSPAFPALVTCCIMPTTEGSTPPVYKGRRRANDADPTERTPLLRGSSHPRIRPSALRRPRRLRSKFCGVFVVTSPSLLSGSSLPPRRGSARSGTFKKRKTQTNTSTPANRYTTLPNPTRSLRGPSYTASICLSNAKRRLASARVLDLRIPPGSPKRFGSGIATNTARHHTVDIPGRAQHTHAAIRCSPAVLKWPSPLDHRATPLRSRPRPYLRAGHSTSADVTCAASAHLPPRFLSGPTAQSYTCATSYPSPPFCVVASLMASAAFGANPQCTNPHRSESH